MKRPEPLTGGSVPPRDSFEGATEVIACPDCGLRQLLEPVPGGFRAECHRCRRPLAHAGAARLDAALALLVAAALAFIPACIAPLLVVHADGAVRESVLTSGVAALWSGGYAPLAVVVAAFSIAVPLAYLALMIAVLAGVRILPAARLGGAAGPRLGLLFRWGVALRPWTMIEVYLLGACVAYSRMQAVAFVSVGTAGWLLVAAGILVLLADAALDAHAVWQALPLGPHAAAGASTIACRACDLPVRDARPGDHCPRCRARLTPRKPLSMQRTWALVLCGFILFIPANLLPVLTIEQFGRSDPNTILGGVRELIHLHLWPLAAIVFLASIAIPLAKLCGLSWNLFLTQRGSARCLVGRTRLHRAIDLIGRWSNIDVFMLSILVALVQFGTLTRVRAEAGMIAFAAVVIVTMLATKSFDSRLMWDAAGKRT
ncbi:MAG: paraquat-inducible protein A [Steroidobacteraceae bacterium]